MPRSAFSLFRRIERALETIALGSTPLKTIHTAADFLADNFADDLGIRGGRIYAQDRLIHSVRTVRHRDPIAVVDRVFSDVDEFSATSPPADDQTLVVVKRRAPEPEEIPA